MTPIEVKPSATLRPAMAEGIRAFAETVGAKAAPGCVVHPGDVRLTLGGGVTALPLEEL